jgi:hypothetical protein
MARPQNPHAKCKVPDPKTFYAVPWCPSVICSKTPKDAKIPGCYKMDGVGTVGPLSRLRL